MPSRRRNCEYPSWNMKRNADQIWISPWLVNIYFPLRFLLLGWWIYVAYETSQIWRQFKLTPDLKQREHGVDIYNAVGLLYPVSVIYIFWTMISCAMAYKMFSRSWLFGLTVPEAFFLTLITASLALQVKSLPSPIGSCSNADSSPIFEAITKALPWICDTHSIGDNQSYKTCTPTNTKQLTCAYFKANWRATIVSFIFSALNLVLDICATITHASILPTFGYVPASFRYLWRVVIRPGREVYYRSVHRYEAAKKRKASTESRPLIGKRDKRKQSTGASRSPSNQSQKGAGIQLSVLALDNDVLHVPEGTPMTYLPRLPNQSALERFLRIDDMFLTLAHFLHSRELQLLGLTSKTLGEIVEYHKSQNKAFLMRHVCNRDARSGHGCWACGMFGCVNCFNLQPTVSIPADEVEHQSDHIEALCSDCYYKHLNPILPHPPDELSRAWSQTRPKPPPRLRDCGFRTTRGVIPCAHGCSTTAQPAHQSSPRDRARAICGYSRYCSCSTHGVERSLCTGCRVSYRVEYKRLKGAREAGDGLRELRRQTQAAEIAQGKTPSSRTGTNQDCVYCGKDLQKWWQMRWWRCEVCWEELRTKLV